MLNKVIIAALSASLLAGCADDIRNNPNTAGGAIIGALAGAAVGTLFKGSDRRNALVGAGIGMLAGAAVGQYMDQQERDLRRDLEGTGAEIDRQGDDLLISFPSNVTFGVDQSNILPGFHRTLDDVSATLNRYPKSYLDVIGHTDSTGAADYNQALSERRADSVADYLRNRRVDQARIAAYGKGETLPVASNDTSYGRQQNRRVELRIAPATEG